MANLSRYLVTGALFLLLTTVSLPQSSSPPPRLIIVSGNGLANMDPEVATIRLGILTQAPSAKAAQSQASGISQKIIAALRKLGISEKAIQTDALTLESVYREAAQDSTKPPTLVAYRARNSVRVTVTDLKKIGPAVDAAIEAGSNEVEEIKFGVLNDVKARQAALKDAVLEARLKAEAIAEALGIKVAGVFEASEAGYGYSEDRVAALESRVPSTAVMPGQITIRANVTVKFLVGS